MPVMRIAGESRDDGPYVICGVRTLTGTFGGEAEFLLDTGASRSLLSLFDFRRLGGKVTDLRPTKAIRLTSLTTQVPCRLLEGAVLDFRGEEKQEVHLEFDHIAVPTAELWAPSMLGRDFLRISGWILRYQPSRGVCELGAWAEASS